MNQTLTPLWTALHAHQQRQPVSFHVPGHKNGLLLPWADVSLDATELAGLDDLHAPDECIKAAEQLLSGLHQTKESRFLVNGSTVGNMAMILGTLSKGDTVFVQRNCHKSVLNALKMAEACPVFLRPEVEEQTKTAVCPSIETVKEAYRLYPDCRAVIFTAPTYYGMTGAVGDLIAFVKSNGSLVLVDEAHGAHFVKGAPGMPPGALELGADLVVQSAHKTLPAMTMGAYLHIQLPEARRERIHFYLQALQSSSPSYMIMASLDWARAYLASYSQADHLYSMGVKNRLMALLKEKKCLCVPVEDPYKLLVRAPGYTGYELQHLLESAGIWSELADPEQVLFLFPLLKENEQIFEKKAAAKLQMLQTEERQPASPFPPSLQSVRVSKLELPYNKHNQFKKTAVPLAEAAGEVSAEMIVPYPPGIPLVMEGERLSSSQISQIQWLLKAGARFHGGSKLNEQQAVVLQKERNV